MKQHVKSRRRRVVTAGTILAAAVMLALVPLNMGGCSAGSIGNVVGGAVGGTTGQLIGAGGKAVQAEALGEAQEPAMGESVAVAITNRYGLDPNVALNKYVTLVGWTVASASPAADLRFNFGVLDTDEVNAYAGPAGYVMVTRGALMRMQDESELAGVLAHEIAHVRRRHVTEALLRELGIGALIRLFAGGIGANAQQLVSLSYTRANEAEADADAIASLRRAGIDPRPTADLFRRLGGERTEAGSLQWLESHPASGGRARLFATSHDPRVTYRPVLSDPQATALYDACLQPSRSRPRVRPAPARR